MIMEMSLKMLIMIMMISMVRVTITMKKIVITLMPVYMIAIRQTNNISNNIK